MATATRVNASLPTSIRKYTVAGLTPNDATTVTLDFDPGYGSAALNFVLIVLRAPSSPAAPTNSVSYDPAAATYESIDIYTGDGNTVDIDLYVG